MRTLAIETATSACSVALFDGDALVDHAHVEVGRGHAERLLPMIAGLAGGGRADAILVDVGPGSFTGIRVGIAAARALGFGWEASVHGFASLTLLAARVGFSHRFTVAIEGGHGEVFIARYLGCDEVQGAMSLPFDNAVCDVTDEVVIGNAAERLVMERGWGSAHLVLPDARAVSRISREARELSPVPRYARPPDAKPLAWR